MNERMNDRREGRVWKHAMYQIIPLLYNGNGMQSPLILSALAGVAEVAPRAARQVRATTVVVGGLEV